MQASVKTQVTEVALKSDYAKKPNGLTDYDRKIEYFDSTLSVLDNAQHIRGTLILRERLEIGSIHELIIDTDSPEQVVEMAGLSESRLKAE